MALASKERVLPLKIKILVRSVLRADVLLPELISRDCESCSPSLKKDGQTLLEQLKERYPTEWIIISHMYDQEIYDIPGYYTTPLMPPL